MPTANDNAFTDKAYFCAACGSALVDASSFIGGEASCGVCDWHGKVEDLAVVPFSQEVGSPEEVLRQLFIDIRGLFSKAISPDLIRLLLKWGFLNQPINRQEVARYFGGIAKSVAQGIVATRAEIEKEKAGRG